jgi:TonB family protein
MFRKLAVWAVIAALISLCPRNAFAAKPQGSPCGLRVYGAFVTRTTTAGGVQAVARVALVLSAPQPELVSGTLRLYSGNERLSASIDKAPILVGPTGIFVNAFPARPLDGYDATLKAGGEACELPAMPFMEPGPDVQSVLDDDATATGFVTSQQEKLPPLRCGAVETAVTPKTNISAQVSSASLNVNGTAKVLVVVGADGSVESTEIAESSGNKYFDSAALAAARRAAYRPATYRCVPREGTFVFTLSLQ